MKNRKVQYAVWILGSLSVTGAYIALAFEVFPVRAGGSVMGVFWMWNGFCLMMDWHPEYRAWDRWQKQVYGLAFAWMGTALVAIGYITSPPNVWLLLSFTFVPPALIALIGRGWYVNKKRSEEWKKQNQIEKD